jgi:hypothetical protein
MQIPSKIKSMPTLQNKAYDLVILGYQPWFLHPSIPFNSFLKSEWAQVLRNKNIVTVIGSRNMWLNAQEKVKASLKDLQAHLVGNIVLEDKHTNVISTLTIIRWLFKGKKEASGLLPAAGVSGTDIAAASRFGSIIWNHFQHRNVDALQDALVAQDAVVLNPGLIVLEKRGLSQFPKWAKKALAKGGPGSAARKPIINQFKNLLITAIFVLSPISALTAKIQTLINLKKLKKEVNYFKGTVFQEGML